MSNLTDKVKIANMALLALGEKPIVSLTPSATDPNVNKINALLEQTIKEQLSDNWTFNTARAILSRAYKLTLDAAPATAWIAGTIITGETSGATATIVEVISTKIFIITKPTLDFVDGEIINDGTTNEVDCGTGYPLCVEYVAEFGTYQLRYALPADCLLINKLSDPDYDDLLYRYAKEGLYVVTNETEAYLIYNKFIGESGSLEVSDVTRTPIWFHRLVSARLAYIMAPNLTENSRIRQKVEIEWQEAHTTAREQNGNETFNNYQGISPWGDNAFAQIDTEI